MKRTLPTVIIILCLFSIQLRGQSDPVLFEEKTLDELELNSGQSAKYNVYKSNNIYKYVNPIVIGNLKALFNRQKLPIKLPGQNAPVIFEKTSIETYDDLNFEFYGISQDGEGEIHLTGKDGKLLGNLHYKERIFEIYDLGLRKNIIVEFSDIIKQGSDCALGSIEQEQKNHIENKPVLETRNAGNITRLLILYTAKAAYIQSPTDVATAAVSQLNQALVNSQVPNTTLCVQIAAVKPLYGFNETQSIGGDLNALITNVTAGNLREQHQADLVILLTDGNYGNYLGLAQLGPRVSSVAYAIVEADCATALYTFAHEVTHLFGCDHVGGEYLAILQSPMYARGYGWRKCLFCSWKGTIHGSANHIRYQYFSNPNVNYDGVFIGNVTYNDNARQLREQASTVSNYRLYVPIVEVQISGPAAGFNNTTYTWCAQPYNCSTVTSYKWFKSLDGYNYTQVGSSSCYSSTLPNNADMWMKVTITCSNGQTATHILKILNGNNPNCNPCPIAEPDISINENIKIGARIKMIKTNPNPVQTMVNIQIENGINELHGQIKIISHLGEVKYIGDISGNTFNVNVHDWQPGLFYIIYQENNQILTTKFLKL